MQIWLKMAKKTGVTAGYLLSPDSITLGLIA